MPADTGAGGLPPADLHRRPLPLVGLHGPWYRIHQARFPAVHFGRSGSNRFDAPHGDYGVLYVAADLHCAFIETFGPESDTRLIALRELAGYHYCHIGGPDLDLRAVDIVTGYPDEPDLDERLCRADYATAQRWSEAFYRHPSEPDGILYRSCQDGSRLCLALFERPGLVQRLLHPGVTVDGGSLLSAYNTVLIEHILHHYGYGVV